jgi:putative transport protein
MEWFVHTLRVHPELALFLTIALGFFIGQFKYKSFSLGTVTSVLLVGFVVGQMNIDISSDVKKIFFLIFLFSVGYRVGPQFFNSLRKSGLPQLLFSTILAAVSLVSTWFLAKPMGYDAGQAAGLFAGSQTVSAVIGVGSDTISTLALNPEVKKSMINAIPVCYAVTYLFGTIGSAIFLAQIGPLFWGGLKSARNQCVELAARLGIGSDDPTIISSFTNVAFRAYNLTPGSMLIGKTVAEAQQVFFRDECRIYIEKVRRKGTRDILDPSPDFKFEANDDVVLQGESAYVISKIKDVGTEFFDKDLLDFPVESVRVMLTNKEVDGMTIRELSHQRYDLRVSIKKITRGDTEIPLMPETKLQRVFTL